MIPGPFALVSLGLGDSSLVRGKSVVIYQETLLVAGMALGSQSTCVCPLLNAL